MIDYSSARKNERFVVRRLPWPTADEVEDVETFTGGTIDLDDGTAFKVSASLNFEGRTEIGPHDMFRVYYSFENSAGESTMAPLATLVPDVPRHGVGESSEAGSVSCSSVLSILDGAMLGTPYTVRAGSRPLGLATLLIENKMHLEAVTPMIEDRVQADMTFPPDATVFEVVSWLASSVGYVVRCDPMGSVVFQRDEEPTAAVRTFEAGPRSIMLPEIQRDDDMLSAPNVVHAFYDAQDVTYWARATNDDPTSETSVQSRGREVSESVSVFDFDPEAPDPVGRLKALARDELMKRGNVPETVSLTAAWTPLRLGDGVSIEYASVGSWVGRVTALRIDLAPSAQTSIEARRQRVLVREVTIEGGSF